MEDIPLVAHSKISLDGSSEVKSLAEDGSVQSYIDNMVTCASKHLVEDQNIKENLEAGEEKNDLEGIG